MSFTIFQNENTLFQAINTASSKSGKVYIPSKGFAHGFGPKMAIFPTFFLGNVGQNNVFYDILKQKTSFQAIKTRNSNSPKIVIFLTFFFFAVQARKMSFTIFYNKKTPFQAIKTRSLKRQKIDIFPKGLTHGFGPKMAIFLSFFFQAIQGRKMFFMILWNEKKPFQTIKTRSSKSRKIHIFPKGLTHGLVPRMAIFPTVFFFRQERPGKCLLRYSRTKNVFLFYENKNLKKSKN